MALLSPPPPYSSSIKPRPQSTSSPSLSTPTSIKINANARHKSRPTAIRLNSKSSSIGHIKRGTDHEKSRIVAFSSGIERIGRGSPSPEECYGVPARVKVVALVAFVMALCNADRVVMSVAVVPLAAKFGWSSSFLGIVQVINCLLF